MKRNFIGVLTIVFLVVWVSLATVGCFKLFIERGDIAESRDEVIKIRDDLKRDYEAQAQQLSDAEVTVDVLRAENSFLRGEAAEKLAKLLEFHGIVTEAEELGP